MHRASFLCRLAQHQVSRGERMLRAPSLPWQSQPWNPGLASGAPPWPACGVLSPSPSSSYVAGTLWRGSCAGHRYRAQVRHPPLRMEKGGGHGAGTLSRSECASDEEVPGVAEANSGLCTLPKALCPLSTARICLANSFLVFVVVF